MKLIITVLALFFIWLQPAYALDVREAKKFAGEYAQEAKINEENKKNMWHILTNLKVGAANYKEEEQTVSSDYKAVYSEFLCAAVNQSNNDIEKAIDFSFGQSTTDTETWYISDIKYQTNDLDFYRINLKGSIGKILYSDKYKNLQVVPFLGYGFRYINFKRADFNILDIITFREVVTEKYSIHHCDFGLKFNNALGDKWNIFGLGSFGYVFYNQADNSYLGKTDGAGGYLFDGNINLQYSLSDSWQFIFGGFFELQNLNGGQKSDVVWPDNKLNIYGGNIGIRLLF